MDVREKLVEIVCDVLEDGCVGHCNHPPCWKVTHAVDGLIAHGVTVQEWISVNDRLPNLDESVLVHAEHLHIKINYYEVWSLFKCQSGKTIWVDQSGEGHNLTEVTHWMPLPKLPQPPKGE